MWEELSAGRGDIKKELIMNFLKLYPIMLLALGLLVGCSNPKIRNIKLKKSPMIEICFDESMVHSSYEGEFIIKTKNGLIFTNRNRPKVIIDTALEKDPKCETFNPFLYLADRWTSDNEWRHIKKNLTWSNISSITFILYTTTWTGELEKISEYTQKIK